MRMLFHAFFQHVFISDVINIVSYMNANTMIIHMHTEIMQMHTKIMQMHTKIIPMHVRRPWGIELSTCSNWDNWH